MRKLILSLCFSAIFVLISCSEGQRIPDAFVGTWQSDKTLTLASLDDSESVSEEDMAMFSGDFFGDRVFAYAPRKFRAYWVGEEWVSVEQEVRWLDYDIVASGPDFMTLSSLATEYANAETKTWRVDGDLIYVEEPRWDFREYYRRYFALAHDQ